MFSQQSILAASMAMILGISALPEPQIPNAITSLGPFSTSSAPTTTAPAIVERQDCRVVSSHGPNGGFTETSCNSARPRPTATILNMFDAGIPMNGYAAAVLKADACDTTLALQCTAAAAACAGNTKYRLTMTGGPTAYEFDYSTSAQGQSYSVTRTCDLYGPYSAATKAICSDVSKHMVQGSMSIGRKLDTTVYSPLSSVPVTITTNADRLPTAGVTCTKKAKHGAASPTGISEVYKVLIPVGAALVAGAGAMI